MTSTLVCLTCRVDVDGFTDRGEALDAARTHDEERHDGRPVAFVVSPDPVWLGSDGHAPVVWCVDECQALVAGMPGGGKGAPFGPWGGAA